MPLFIRDEVLEEKLEGDASRQSVPISKTALASHILRKVCELAEADGVDAGRFMQKLSAREVCRQTA
jgi:hypothetical protein